MTNMSSVVTHSSRRCFRFAPRSVSLTDSSPSKSASTERSNSDASVLIILNWEFNPAALSWLWKCTTHHICADGGANRLFDCVRAGERRGKKEQRGGEGVGRRAVEERETTREQGNKKENVMIPDAIAGDLDSLRPEVRGYYSQQGTSIVTTPDQNRNDFQKCIEFAARHCMQWDREKEEKYDREKAMGQEGASRVDGSLEESTKCASAIPGNGNGGGSEHETEVENTNETTTGCSGNQGGDGTRKRTVVVLGGIGGRIDQTFCNLRVALSRPWEENVGEDVFGDIVFISKER